MTTNINRPLQNAVEPTSLYSILIVDDEPEFVNNFRAFFAKREFTVDTAADGLEGLEKLRSHQYDVALLDIKMPKLDGVTLAQHVKDERLDTSVIIMTGHGDRVDAINAIKADVDDWFDKTTTDFQQVYDRAKELADVTLYDLFDDIFDAVPKLGVPEYAF